MASFEPTVVVFGCSGSIAAVNLRLPVSSLFAFDVTSLEQIVNVSPQLSDICLHRYFIILLDSIDEERVTCLKANHRVVVVYRRDEMCGNSQDQMNRMTNSFRQLTLDMTNDIVRFLTMEGEKQIKLERMPLVKIYYQQARVLKEWAMSLFKAEPCHILLISLNSSQENIDDAQQRLQKVCDKVGYTSVVIRQLNDYMPREDRYSSLLPYAKQLFNYEHPHYMCQLIKKLSPIRLYLYGNELRNLSEWSKLMISNENDIMNDEDNWCAFLENEYIDNEIKWNFCFMFGREWKVKRVAPLRTTELDENPRFHSALRRAHITFAERQMEVTAEIFDWYADCISRRYLEVKPKLTPQQKAMKINRRRQPHFVDFMGKYRFQCLSSFDYRRLDSSKNKSISFIWFDEILHDADSEFNRIIEPFQWQFFSKISDCLSFIEIQLREHRHIFLIVSGLIGHELFLTGQCLMKQIFAAYIYCAHLGPHLEWTPSYTQIRGVFNDSKELANKITQDVDELKKFVDMNDTGCCTESNTTDGNNMLQQVAVMEWPSALPLLVYDQEQAHSFMAHQRTIDSILCMPHTLESQAEMITEFRRMYSDNEAVLSEIDNFENNYHSNAAVRWYTRDSFVWRTINQALRTSNVDAMFKLRYILTDIYTHLNESHKQTYGSFPQSSPETLYRGQVMSNKEFNLFKDLRGSVISINTFLSTTQSMQIALMYASKFHTSPDVVSVVFDIETYRGAHTRPYANISQHSMFPDEDEILFAMGSVFRIGNIRELRDADSIWVIHLKLTDLDIY